MTDDFVELVKRTTKTVSAPVVMRTSLMRGNLQRASISLTRETFERINNGDRLAVAWSSTKRTFRLRGDRNGAFQAHRTPMGDHYLLRVDMPKEMLFVSGAVEAAAHQFINGELFVSVPDVFLGVDETGGADQPTLPAPQETPKAAPPEERPKPATPMTRKEMIEMAARTIPPNKYK